MGSKYIKKNKEKRNICKYVGLTKKQSALLNKFSKETGMSDSLILHNAFKEYLINHNII